MDGFLLLLRRTFDDEPLEFLRDKATAIRRARERLRALAEDPLDGPDPAGKRGSLGPPGLVSRVLGITVVEFKGGLPVPEKAVTVAPARPTHSHARER